MYAAIIGMVSKANNELKQYLTSSNPIYAKYLSEGRSVGRGSQFCCTAWKPIMHAYGVKNPVHAGDIIAQSKATVLTFNCCLTYN